MKPVSVPVRFEFVGQTAGSTDSTEADLLLHVVDIADVKSSLRSVMWRNVGIERSGERLAEMREIIAFWSRYVMDKVFDPTALGAPVTAGWELQNMLTVCYLIATAAEARTAAFHDPADRARVPHGDQERRDGAREGEEHVGPRGDQETGQDGGFLR